VIVSPAQQTYRQAYPGRIVPDGIGLTNLK